MRKLFLFVAFVAMTAMSSAAQDNAAWPWDFPISTGEQLTDGELVLAPYTYYKVAIDDGEDLKRKGLIFYKTNLETAGAEKSVVNYMGSYELPNSLIIGIPEGATAKKGDILLTWWQSGSGMKRAIVRDDSDPAAPKVDYLDMDLKENEDGTLAGFAESHANEQLKPNTFIVLHDGEWEPGSQVAHPGSWGDWAASTLIKATDDKVLVLDFGSKIGVYPRAECRLIPLSDEGIKPGDVVFGAPINTYETFTVEKVDKERGRVWGTDRYGKRRIINILQATKVFDE